VYNDDFAEDADSYLDRSGQFDEDGNRLVQNTESNGRFHTDWLNMIYPRLKLAKSLLSDDGVIFISIDDNEVENLMKICDELFGSSNRIGPIVQNKKNAKNDTINVQKNHEFILIYRKQRILDGSTIKPNLVRKEVSYKDVIEDNGEFFYLNDPITTRGEGGTLNARPNLGYTVYYNPISKDKIAVSDYDVVLAHTSNEINDIYTDDESLIQKGYVPIRPPKVRGKLGCWTWAIDKFNNEKKSIITGKPGSYSVRKRTFVAKENVVNNDGKLQYQTVSLTNSKSIIDYSTNEGTNVLSETFDGSIFNNPKNLDMLKYLTSLFMDNNFYVLDFFSGSATTAHAVMQLNAEDGGHRKFIMVQLPELTDEKSEAYKAGYKNICEIGKERIRRAAKKIAEEHPGVDFDGGFRVLKLDSSNMQEVYYTPADFQQSLLDETVDNIKPDRTPEDLLFQVMLDLGVLLSSKIVETTICGKKVFNVEDNFLIACFDENVTEDVITAIAKQKPYYFVMRDNSMANDSVATNFDQIFETYSPDTDRKVL
jgi:adenine-specific DNA-methyltransferase